MRILVNLLFLLPAVVAFSSPTGRQQKVAFARPTTSSHLFMGKIVTGRKGKPARSQKEDLKLTRLVIKNFIDDGKGEEVIVKVEEASPIDEIQIEKVENKAAFKSQLAAKKNAIRSYLVDKKGQLHSNLDSKKGAVSTWYVAKKGVVRSKYGEVKSGIRNWVVVRKDAIRSRLQKSDEADAKEAPTVTKPSHSQ